MAFDRRPRRAHGIDQPRSHRHGLPRLAVDPEYLGRAADRVARFLGSWRFIGYMTIVVVVWLGWNTLTPRQVHFDTYPFILLTLALSLQASYAAPLILLAQNRQADRDRVQYEHDRVAEERNFASTEYLTREVAALRIAIGEVATRDFVRGELQRLLEELDDKRASASDGGSVGRDEHSRSHQREADTVER